MRCISNLGNLINSSIIPITGIYLQLDIINIPKSFQGLLSTSLDYPSNRNIAAFKDPLTPTLSQRARGLNSLHRFYSEPIPNNVILSEAKNLLPNEILHGVYPEHSQKGSGWCNAPRQFRFPRLPTQPNPRVLIVIKDPLQGTIGRIYSNNP